MPYEIGVPFVEEARTMSPLREFHGISGGTWADTCRIESCEGTSVHLRLTFFPGGHTAAPPNHAAALHLMHGVKSGDGMLFPPELRHLDPRYLYGSSHCMAWRSRGLKRVECGP